MRALRPVRERLPLPESWPAEYRSAHRPWLDEADGDEVFFGSVHLWDDKGLFYPGAGRRRTQESSSARAAGSPSSTRGTLRGRCLPEGRPR